MTPTEETLYRALLECQKYFNHERDNTDGELEVEIETALRAATHPHQVPGQTYLF